MWARSTGLRDCTSELGRLIRMASYGSFQKSGAAYRPQYNKFRIIRTPKQAPNFWKPPCPSSIHHSTFRSSWRLGGAQGFIKLLTKELSSNHKSLRIMVEGGFLNEVLLEALGGATHDVPRTAELRLQLSLWALFPWLPDTRLSETCTWNSSSQSCQGTERHTFSGSTNTEPWMPTEGRPSQALDFKPPTKRLLSRRSLLTRRDSFAAFSGCWLGNSRARRLFTRLLPLLRPKGARPKGG